MIGTDFLVGWPFKTLFNWLAEIFYGLYFAIVKAIAWVLDMLTQLFFIFAGMTPISNGNIDATTGEYESVDIVNFFLTQKSFQKAYFWLCMIALGLIVVFTIAKIIKQDYFDRSGPRSKSEIFRHVALSFIAFICVIPVFYFLIDVVGSLALLVMKAMGYKGGGIGSMLFDLSWEDGGVSVRNLAQGLDSSKIYDPDNFGWYSKDTFYKYYWNSSNAEKFSGNDDIHACSEFYWYIFIFAGLILIVNLAQMLLTMVSRMYKLIALFIIAPSPISQIVLDGGSKFNTWKNKVLGESFKVVSCVLGFMLFMMIASAVDSLDLMRFAYTDKAASAFNLIEDNNFATQLSYGIDTLYYGGDTKTWADKAINALGKVMILIAGVGAIKDMDSVIAPLLAGDGASAFDSGQTGKAISTAAGAAGKAALGIARKGVGLATKAVDLGIGALGKGVDGAKEGIRSLKGGDGKTPISDGGKSPLGGKDSPLGGGPGGKGAGDNSPASTPTKPGGGPGGSSPTSTSKDGKEETDDNSKTLLETLGAPTEGGEGTPEEATAPEGTNAPTEGGEGTPEEAIAPEGTNALTEGGEETPEEATAPEGTNALTEGGKEKSEEGVGVQKDTSKPLPTVEKGKKDYKPSLRAKITAGGAIGLRSLIGGAAKAGVSLTGTALKTGGSIAGIAAKALFTAVGMGGIANAVAGTVKDTAKDIGGYFGVEKDKDGKPKLDKNGNPIYKSNIGKAVGEAGRLAGAGAKKLGNVSSVVNKAISSKIAKDDQARQDKKVLESSDSNINDGVKTAEKTLENNGDITDVTENIMNNADNLQEDATAANEMAKYVGAEASPQLETTDPKVRAERQAKVESTKQAYDAAQEEADVAWGKYADVGRTVNAQQSERNSRNSAMGDVKSDSYKALKKTLNTGDSGVVHTFAKKRGVAQIARQAKADLDGGKLDQKQYDDKIRQCDLAYMALSGQNVNGASDALKGLEKEIGQQSEYQDLLQSSKGEGVKKAHGVKFEGLDGRKHTMRSYDNESSVKNLITEQNEVESEYEAGMRSRAATVAGAAQSKLNTAKNEYDNARTNASNADTAMDRFVDAKEEYRSASADYESAKEAGDKTKMTEAKSRLTKAGNKLTIASGEVTKAMVGTQKKADEKNASNAELNAGYEEHDQQLGAMRTNIQRMKASGAPASKIQAAEKAYDRLSEEGQKARSEKRKVKAKVKLDPADKKSKRVKSSKVVSQTDKVATRAEGIKSQRSNMKQRYDLDIQVVEEMANNGFISQELANACRYSQEDSPNSIPDFNAAIESISADPMDRMDDIQLNEAIQAMDPNKAKKAMDTSGKSFEDYRTDLGERYRAASASYSSSVNRAKAAMTAFNNSKDMDPDLLAEAKRAIAEAYNHGVNLKNIKIEIEDSKK